MNIEKLQAYLPRIFTELRHKNSWTLNQTKLFMYALSQLYKHKIKIGTGEYTNERIEEIDLKHVPRKISISRDEIVNVTKIPVSQFSREIKNITRGIMESVATIPSLSEPDNPHSYRQRKWFDEFEYLAGKGILVIEIDQHLLPYLVVFANYTRIKLSDIFMFKHNYSCDLYMYFKLNFNRHVVINKITLSLVKFKRIINMEKSYISNNAMFQKKIITNIFNEINTLTDLNFNYKLHKTGKRFTDISLEVLQKKYNSSRSKPSRRYFFEKDFKLIAEGIHEAADDPTLIISAQLQSYGLSKIKSLEYLANYGEEVCKLGIDKLLNEIYKGRVIKNISGYLISCIENAGYDSDSAEVEVKTDPSEEIECGSQLQEIDMFNRFDSYINRNREQVISLFTRREKREKLINETEINMYNNLQNIVARYKNLTTAPYCLTLRLKNTILDYNKINLLIEDLQIATKKERIQNIKMKLDLKKINLKKVGEQDKLLIEKEITMLKLAIADLV